MDDGVIVMVTGTVTTDVTKQFVQCFVLVRNGKTSYYVHNDTFRIVDVVSHALSRRAPSRRAPVRAAEPQLDGSHAQLGRPIQFSTRALISFAHT